MTQPQTGQQSGASLKPSDQVAGGPPVQQNLLIQSARFTYFDYEGKAQRTFAVRLDLLTDSGQSHIQHYSVGDPSRWMPSQDFKRAVPLGTTQGISLSSNAGILIQKVVSAGFPENRLSDDISVFDGIYAYWDGIPEPSSRSNLRQGQDQQRGANVILVPTQIHRLPWESQTQAASTSQQLPHPPGAGNPPPPPPPPPPSPGIQSPPPPPPPSASLPDPAGSTPSAPAVPPANGFVNEALDLASKTALANNNNFTLQQMVALVFQDYASHPQRDQLAGFIFSPDCQSLLSANGYLVQGHQVEKVG